MYAIAPWLGIGGLVGHCSVLLIAEPKGETSNRDALSSPVCRVGVTITRRLAIEMLHVTSRRSRA